MKIKNQINSQSIDHNDVDINVGENGNSQESVSASDPKLINNLASANFGSDLIDEQVNHQFSDTASFSSLRNQSSKPLSDQEQMNSLMGQQRIQILLPKIEASGRPSCIKSPDDTYCEDVPSYPKFVIY